VLVVRGELRNTPFFALLKVQHESLKLFEAVKKIYFVVTALVRGKWFKVELGVGHRWQLDQLH
jgi:hypothetical protein